MVKIHYEADASLAPLIGKRIAVLGYGSQGRGQALNLRDSGLDVMVGLRRDSWSRGLAQEDGLEVLETGEAATYADLIAVLVPDELQADAYARSIRPALRPGKTLLFSHGFNIRFGRIEPPGDVDVVMVAPKSPGHLLRRVFADGGGVPALMAIHTDATGHAAETALAYAKGIGSTRAGVLETTFAEETETDLFGEQAVLCGGLTSLIQAGFETLVEAGYQPELAYFECLHEMKLIVDLIYEGGLANMRHSISNTAEYGDLTRGPRVIGPEVRARMRELLEEIRSGAFADDWTGPAARSRLEELRARQEELPVEQVGRRLRSMMAWLPDVGGRKAEAVRRPAGDRAGDAAPPGRSSRAGSRREPLEVSA